MIKLFQTSRYKSWQRSLQDPLAQKQVAKRMAMLELGMLGDTKALGGGLFEMRIHTGPGYRIYFAWRGSTVVLLLCGGDKSSQTKDIWQAREIASNLKDFADD